MFRFNQISSAVLFIALPLGICAAAPLADENLGVLGAHPKWKVLERYQRTITHDDFARLIQSVYCTHGFAGDLISIEEKSARILINREAKKFFTLRFAEDAASSAPVPRLWRPAKALPPPPTAERPLAGLRIALDPGHLGGAWAKMEERWFQVGNSTPVTEGDLVLRVARLVAARLQELGARVSFVRNGNEPVTWRRPDDFKELARKILIKNGVPQPRSDFLNPDDPEKEQTIRW